MANRRPAMTPKQLRFAQGLAAGKDQTQAYIDAGYSARGPAATAHASRLARNGMVKDYVSRAMEKGLQKAELKAADVIGYLARVMVEGTEEARKSNGTRFVKTVGTAHRIRAADLLGRMFRLWTEGVTVTVAPAGVDYSLYTDDELRLLDELLSRTAPARAPLIDIIEVPQLTEGP